MLLAAFGEERLQDGGAVGGKDTRGDFYVMVEAGMGEDFEAGADGTAFGVVGAVDEAWDAGLDDGASAHATRLDCDVEGIIGEAVVAEKAGGFAKDNHLRMSRGVIVADGTVAGTGENLAVMHEHGADRDFATCGGGTGLSKGFSHELNVGFHLAARG